MNPLVKLLFAVLAVFGILAIIFKIFSHEK